MKKLFKPHYKYFLLFFVFFSAVYLLFNYYMDDYLRDQVSSYLGNYTSEENNVYIDRLMRIQNNKRNDSVILWQISDEIASDKAKLIIVIDSLMSRNPAAVGLDILFRLEDVLTAEDTVLSNLPRKYDNLVYPYDYSQEVVDYPWKGIFNPIPNMGYVNARKEKEQNEIRYLNLYDNVDGEIRPAFWTQLWLLSHREKEKIHSSRVFINYSLNEFICSDINRIESISDNLDEVEGRVVIVCLKDKDSRIYNDLGIVPVRIDKYEYNNIMPGPKIICCALQTIIYNEYYRSIGEKYRIIISILIILALSLITTFFHYSQCTWLRCSFANFGNCLQIIAAVILFFVAEYLLPAEKEEWWHFFAFIALYVIAAPALDELIGLLLKKRVRNDTK